MIFHVRAIDEGDYKATTGDSSVPDSVELKSVADLIAWTDRCGGRIILSTESDERDPHGPYPKITVYNDYAE